jgi:sulfofructose kinase
LTLWQIFVIFLNTFVRYWDNVVCVMNNLDATGYAVFVGAAAQDVIALVPRFPHPDERLVAEEIVNAGGGPAATAAVAFARLGGQAYFVGAVGGDKTSESILDGLRAEGVDINGVIRVPGARSMHCVVLVDHGRATRAICALPGPALAIPKNSRAAEIIRGASWMHTDHAGWQSVRDFLRGRDSAAVPRLSVDLGNVVAGFTAKGIDLFVPTQQQLVALYGQKPLPDLLRAAVAEGAKCVVATAGSAGSWALAADGVTCHVAAHQTEILSTVGAGDVFHGALLAAVTRDLPLANCLAYANIAAALSCRGLDGRSAIPRHEEVETAMPSLLIEKETRR